MNPYFHTIITAPKEDRLDLFLSASHRLGTPVQNVEKDFWVCWTLDALFNGLPATGPRFLFKGGTSLSKAFHLISRFSEDIDITFFRDDLGQNMSVADLESLSGNQRRRRLTAIRDACKAYITDMLMAQLQQLATAHLPLSSFTLALDPDDQDQQTLLFWYPSVITTPDTYIRSAVKIEMGAKSALDPHVFATVTPYIATELPDLDLSVPNILTVQAERTFWDKIMILHGLRQWHNQRGVLRHEGQRVSRHYYDIHQLMQTALPQSWQNNRTLALDCAQHASLFFGSPDLGLHSARTGTFTLMPSNEMQTVLERDYRAMVNMIFGDTPSFSTLMSSIERIETLINTP